MKNKIIALAAISLMAMPLEAAAQELCGGFLEKGSTKAVLPDIGPSAKCSITGSGKCSIGISAELRPGNILNDSLWFSRKSKSDKWLVHFQVGKDVDNSEGITITVDNNDPMAIPSEFLSHGPYKFPARAYIDERLTQIVVDQVRAGKTATAAGTYVGGEKFSAMFSEKWFSGAGKAFDWVECMQKAR